MNNSQIYLKAIGHLTAIETSDGYTGYTVYVGMCEAIDRVCEARNLDRRGYNQALQRGMSLELTYPELELFRPTIIPAFDWASPNYGHWYPKTKRGAEIRETILLFCHHMAKSKERSLQRYWAKVDYSMM